MRRPLARKRSTDALAAAACALWLVVVAIAATPARAEHGPNGPRWTYRCDGTDPFFFEEMKKAGAVGYGETWDHTVCDQGVEVYAQGTTSRSGWRAFRPRPRKLTDDQEFYASLMPMAGAASLGVVAAAAGIMALLSRRSRRTRVVDAPCPGCATMLPIVVEDKSTHSLFCPVCGTGCRADVQGRAGPVRLVKA